MHRIDIVWPPVTSTIVSFIGYLSLKQYSHSTISGHIAALSYKCKINDMLDTTKNYKVRSLLEGLRRTRNVKDVRRPINQETLIILIRALSHVCRSQYETLLFSAAFALAFLALLRVSEFTVASNRTSSFVLTDKSIIMGTDCVRIYFRASKNDQIGLGSHVDIQIKDHNRFCYDHLQTFLRYRPKNAGSLFCHLDGSPLSSFQFNAILKKTLKFCGLQNRYFKSHSFRIGGATSMFTEGYHADNIKHTGRWRSNVYKRYIRP